MPPGQMKMNETITKTKFSSTPISTVYHTKTSLYPTNDVTVHQRQLELVVGISAPLLIALLAPFIIITTMVLIWKHKKLN